MAFSPRSSLPLTKRALCAQVLGLGNGGSRGLQARACLHTVDEQVSGSPEAAGRKNCGRSAGGRVPLAWSQLSGGHLPTLAYLLFMLRGVWVSLNSVPWSCNPTVRATSCHSGLRDPLRGMWVSAAVVSLPRPDPSPLSTAPPGGPAGPVPAQPGAATVGGDATEDRADCSAAVAPGGGRVINGGVPGDS